MKSFLPQTMVLISGISVMCCGGAPQKVLAQERVDVRVTNEHTEIVLQKDNGQTIVLARYPLFHAFDRGSEGRGRDIARFVNGNMIVLLPDPSNHTPIKAWNDYAHLFDVVFVNRKTQEVRTIDRAYGLKLRLKMGPSNDIAFVFYVDNGFCTVSLVTSYGNVDQRVKYAFRAYPDVVTVSKTINGYQIVHSNMDSEQTFALNTKSKSIRSTSYKVTSEGSH